MNEGLNVFLSKEFLLIYGMLAILLVLVIIAFIYDSKTKKKLSLEDQSEVPSSEPTVEEQLPVLDEKPIEVTHLDEMLDTTPKVPIQEIAPKSEPAPSEIKYVDPEMEPVEAKQELERISEELKKQEEQPTAIELTNFELEQEEQAIISLEELMKKADNLYLENETTQYEDEGNEPINLQELQQRMQEEQPKDKVVLEDFATAGTTPQVPPIQEHAKFKNSPIISPVFGTLDNIAPQEDRLELENTANYEKLDEEIRKTNEFLQILKELQKKLD